MEQFSRPQGMHVASISGICCSQFIVFFPPMLLAFIWQPNSVCSRCYSFVVVLGFSKCRSELQIFVSLSTALAGVSVECNVISLHHLLHMLHSHLNSFRLCLCVTCCSTQQELTISFCMQATSWLILKMTVWVLTAVAHWSAMKSLSRMRNRGGGNVWAHD